MGFFPLFQVAVARPTLLPTGGWSDPAWSLSLAWLGKAAPCINPDVDCWAGSPQIHLGQGGWSQTYTTALCAHGA